jgi:hypothetical protein
MRNFTDDLLKSQVTSRLGIGFSKDSKPKLNIHHIDGPMMYFSDGQMHWLSLWERFQVRWGLTDAEKLERKLRPNLMKIMGRT